MSAPVYVTQPFLPPLSEFMEALQEPWQTGTLTHNGPLLLRLERELCRYLQVPDLVAVSNGTSAMQIAIRALDLRGEVITTPFTFVATSNIIAWERCTPVYVDIDPDSWNMNPDLIEAAITSRTTAILPVHVFSAPCDVEAIAEIATRHNLRVIYDAAHAAATEHRGESVLRHGDVSCLSFHATKLFNTAEGGGCVTNDPALAARMRRLRFFGFDEGKEIVDEGMNAKLTEVHAALGLVNLRYLDQVRVRRKNKYRLYLEHLAGAAFLKFQKFDPAEYNYSYFPVLFDSESRLERTVARLKQHEIYPRRYFYPSLHHVRKFGSGTALPTADAVARSVLCLPLYDSLDSQKIEHISELVLEA